MNSILYYALIVYFLYHVVAESDLLAKPRAWARKTFPKASYPLDCPFCWTFWVGVFITVETGVTTGMWFIEPGLLFVAPVINLFLGLAAKALRRASETGSRAKANDALLGLLTSDPVLPSSPPTPPLL